MTVVGGPRGGDLDDLWVMAVYVDASRPPLGPPMPGRGVIRMPAFHGAGGPGRAGTALFSHLTGFVPDHRRVPAFLQGGLSWLRARAPGAAMAVITARAACRRLGRARSGEVLGPAAVTLDVSDPTSLE